MSPEPDAAPAVLADPRNQPGLKPTGSVNRTKTKRVSTSQPLLVPESYANSAVLAETYAVVLLPTFVQGSTFGMIARRRLRKKTNLAAASS